MQVNAARVDFSEADRAAILKRIDECLKSGMLTLGKNGKQFEEEFARAIGTKYACAVNSGTSALEIALRIFGVEGKEVIVPTNTFFATAAAVVHAGGRPRFVDTDPMSLNMSVESLKKRWTPNCAGVIAVHIGGEIVSSIQEIRQFCKERNAFLLEDAAHAHGSSLSGIAAGTFGDAAAFSFYPTKVMTSGEGGMLVTNDEKVYNEATIYRDQGKASFTSNIHVRMGYNWRLSELHAIVGQVHLSHLGDFVSERGRIGAWYDEALKQLPEVKPVRLPSGSISNYYKYPVFLPPGVPRAELKKFMKENFTVGLSGEVYEMPLHQQPVFTRYADVKLPNAEEVCQRHVCLPVYTGLTREHCAHVVTSLKETLSKLVQEVRH